MTFHPQRAWPVVQRSIHAIGDLRGGVYGLDFEWGVKNNNPTILGLSDGVTTLSVPWDEGVFQFRRLVESQPEATYVLHNGLQADLPVLAQQDIHIAPGQVDDTILWWYLTHPNLCKSKKKESDDEAERRGAGFMSIYPMVSLFTDLPNWKVCRGELCEGPCPEHDVFGYNGVDALGPVLALPRIKEIAAFRGVDRLYPLHRDLMVALGKMTDVGVLVDLNQREKLRERFRESKLGLWNKATGEGRVKYPDGASVNLDSWQQVKRYFSSEHKVELKDTTEETVRLAAEERPECASLQWLAEYKAAGDGPDRWLADRYWDSKNNEWVGYVDENAVIHSRLGPFTSSGRLMSAGPNLQNVEVRTEFGKEVRRAFIPRPGKMWYKSDYQAAEYRNFLHMAGHRDLPNEDFHTYVGKMIGLVDTDPIVIKEGGIRRAAKTITFGTQYLEGLQLKDSDELKRGKVADEIRMGARIVFKDWMFQGKVVTFTGINLARRAFGEATWANRKRALEFSERFFARFDKVRPFQKWICKQIEKERMVRPPTGYCIPSYGFAEDRIKTAMAIFGSNPVAHFTKHAILRAQDMGLGLRLQVHDELDFEEDISKDPKKVAAVIREVMCFELEEMPGLVLPIDVACGPSWGDCKEIPA